MQINSGDMSVDLTEVQTLLGVYVKALRAAANGATDVLERNDYAYRLAAADRMQAAVSAGDLGRLAAELNEQALHAGWTYAGGEHGNAVHYGLLHLNEATLRARLAGRPPAW